MTDYAWISKALAWVAPVALQAGSFTFYKNKVLAFSNGVAVAEYEAPEQLPIDEPISVQYNVANTIDWSKVTSFVPAKTLELGLYSGKVRLPILERVYDPAAIATEGEGYPATDLIHAISAVLPTVEKKASGAWSGNVHIQGDLVCGMPTLIAAVRFVWIAFELPNNAEIPLDAAKMLIALPLDDDAELFFDGELVITVSKTVEVDGKKTQVSEEVGVSYAGMTVVNGRGKMWIPLAQSNSMDIRKLVSSKSNSEYFVNISPEIAGLFKTVNSLAGTNETPYITMSFGEDGMTVYSDYVEAVKIPAEFSDNNVPNFSVQVQTRLIEVSNKKWLQIGISGSLEPVVIQDDDCTILVQPMGKRS